MMKRASEVKTILVVDDDQVFVAESKRNLGSRRRLLVATDATEASRLAWSAKPDLALVNLRLDDGSAIQVIRELRLLHPVMTIFLVSGYMSTAAVVAAMRAGADNALEKPTTLREILAALDRPAVVDFRGDTPTMKQMEWRHMRGALADCGGNLTHAAEKLGIHRQSLQRSLRRLKSKVRARY